MKGARDLTPQQAAVLRAVFAYRDTESSRASLPPFKVIGEPTLLDLARRSPHTLDDLKGEPDDVRDRYDRLHHWRKTRAQARGVESDVILPRTTLWDLARRPPRTLADLADIVDFGPTRRAMYGQEIVAAIAGR